jgi:hypothetical protein
VDKIEGLGEAADKYKDIMKNGLRAILPNS